MITIDASRSRGRDVREVLNELKWREPNRLGEATLWVLNRRGRRPYSLIPGAEVRSLGPSFFETTRAMIPYHRIFRVTLRGRMIYERPGFEGFAVGGLSS